MCCRRGGCSCSRGYQEWSDAKERGKCSSKRLYGWLASVNELLNRSPHLISLLINLHGDMSFSTHDSKHLQCQMQRPVKNPAVKPSQN